MNTQTTRAKLKIAKQKHYFEAALEFLIEERFQDSENFHVVAETTLHGKDDPYITAQKQGKLPTVVEIYYKGEYVCDVNENMNPTQVVDRITFALSLKPHLEVQKEVLDISRL